MAICEALRAMRFFWYSVLCITAMGAVATAVFLGVLALNPPELDSSWTFFNADGDSVMMWTPVRVGQVVHSLMPPAGTTQEAELVAAALERASATMEERHIDGVSLVAQICPSPEAFAEHLALGRPGSPAFRRFVKGVGHLCDWVNHKPTDVWEFRRENRAAANTMAVYLNHMPILLLWRLETLTTSLDAAGIAAWPTESSWMLAAVYWVGLLVCPEFLTSVLAVRMFPHDWCVALAILVTSVNKAVTVWPARLNTVRNTIVAIRREANPTFGKASGQVISAVVQVAISWLLLFGWTIFGDYVYSWVPGFLTDWEAMYSVYVKTLGQVLYIGLKLTHESTQDFWIQLLIEPGALVQKQLQRFQQDQEPEVPVVVEEAPLPLPPPPPAAVFGAPIDLPEWIFDDPTVPDSYKCTITREVMVCPTMIIPSGQTYDYMSVSLCHRRNGKDPISGTPFRIPEDIAPNWGVRKAIVEFIEEGNRRRMAAANPQHLD
jgi:hypothetical protein